MAEPKEVNKQEWWDELRKPFPKESIGKIPRGGIQLDYVGHASVTDRLLSVDPTWTWEPVAVDEFGNPKLDEFGNLWIKLTIKDVTRYGVGDGKSMKEMIGDALRNAAMRFGVALDLWSREELESGNSIKDAPATISRSAQLEPVESKRATDSQRRAMYAVMAEKGFTGEDAKTIIYAVAGIESFTELSIMDASKIIKELGEAPAATFSEILSQVSV